MFLIHLLHYRRVLGNYFCIRKFGTFWWNYGTIAFV
jgi:hypothetical protein